MKKVYGYIRVSTVDQEDGVSLVEQKESIEKYADKNNLKIVEWFEEVCSAAKYGRPVFDEMIDRLRKNKAEGLIIHKIDRSARNLRDWATLGDLMDDGIDVHFSFESIDFKSRGGRLCADMLAVISSDYIRNLRLETKKGLYGRLKQGVYPFDAPIGYLNTGGGNPKAIDPVKAPLVKKLFALYVTGLYSHKELGPKMYELGLSNRNGKKITRNGIAHILHNPFYIGVIKLRKNGMIFSGAHESIISKELYDQAQDVLAGKNQRVKVCHDFLYRKCIKCGLCKRSLVAEKQKGRVYYRCHIKECPTKTIREDAVEEAVERFLDSLTISEDDIPDVKKYFDSYLNKGNQTAKNKTKSLKLERVQISNRLDTLSEKLLDQVIDNETYQKLKEKLILKDTEIKNSLRNIQKEQDEEESQGEFLELLKSLKNMYFQGGKGDSDIKRRILKILTSNLYFSDGNIEIQTPSVFSHIANMQFFKNCAPMRAHSRTSKQLKTKLQSTVEYEITKPKLGQFIIVQKNQIRVDRDTYLNAIAETISTNLLYCHNVIQSFKTLGI